MKQRNINLFNQLYYNRCNYIIMEHLIKQKMVLALLCVMLQGHIVVECGY